jgi:phage-related protein
MGQGRALKGVGIDFTDTGSAAGNFDQLVSGLTEKVGGFAEVAGGTAAGKAAILKNQFGELQEKVGSALVPALLKVANVFIDDVLPAIESITATVQRNWPQIQATITTAVQQIRAFVKPIIEGLQTLWANFGDNILEYVNRVWPRIQQIIESVMGIIRGIIQTVTSLIKGDWSGAWEGIKSIVSGVWQAIQGLVGTALENLRLAIGAGLEIIGSVVKGAWGGIIDFFKTLPGKLANAGGGMFNFIREAFKAAVNFIIRAWNRLEFKIPGFDPPGPGPKFGGITIGVPDIPTLHMGGVYRAPVGRREGLALLEDGERVLANGQMAGGMNLTQNFYGGVTDRTIRDMIYAQRKLQVEMAG